MSLIISPNNTWIPFPKQEDFISLPFTIVEGFFGGCVGVGKSDLLLRLPLIYGFHKHPLFKGILLRRTFDDLEKEIIPRAKRIYGFDGKNGNAKYNEQHHRFTFPDGGLLFLGHCEHDDDIENYDGAEYNLIMFDELQHFNERPYLYLSTTRRRSATPDLPAIVRNSGMPGGDGHYFVKKRFVDPCPDGRKIIHDKKSGNKRIFIKAEPGDNPALVQNNPNYYNELQELPEADRKAKLGDWNAFSGQVFTEYREKPYSDEPENANHIVEDYIELDKSWPTILVIDIGTTALTYGFWETITPSKQLVIDDEYAVNGGDLKYPQLPQNVDIASWASEFGHRSKDRNIVDCVLDSTAFESRPEGVTIAELFQRHSGLTPRRADKGPGSRIQGRLIVQEYMRWKSKPSFWTQPISSFDPDIAQAILRTKGDESYIKYCKSFQPPDAELVPKLLIKRRCSLLRQAIPVCVYDGEDVLEFHGDDPIDCMRYGVRAADFYLNGNKTQIASDKEMERINNTKDAFVAHMMLQKFHSKNKRQGVRLYKKRI